MKGAEGDAGILFPWQQQLTDDNNCHARRVDNRNPVKFCELQWSSIWNRFCVCVYVCVCVVCVQCVSVCVCVCVYV